MKIFVASWFFPPINTSEALCCYKLLRNSSFNYDVSSSLNKAWCYDDKFALSKDSNIRVNYFNCSDISTWVKKTLKLFNKLNQTEHYDCIMTRSMPEESVELGLIIKKKFPNIKWIASFADPVGNNPYMTRAYVDGDSSLSENEKTMIKNTLKSTDIGKIKSVHKRNYGYFINRLCYLRLIELEALKFADLIIGPNDDLLRYINGTWSSKYYVLPHNYDLSFYKKNSKQKNSKIVFSFLGITDGYRSLLPLVQAVKLIRNDIPNLNKKVIFKFYGILNDETLGFIKANKLDELFELNDSIDYLSSLVVMRQSDFLIHIDAFFKELGESGSVFLAGKIADYLGAGKPIFGITGKNSPAYKVISKTGGIVCSHNPNDIKKNLKKIILGEKILLKKEFVDLYDSKYVGQQYDRKVHSLFKKKKQNYRNVAKAKPYSGDKLITICVPSYNVERTIGKTIYTLINHEMREYLEILIIDDGSKDNTKHICLDYQKKFPNVIKYIFKENGGHGSAINKAIENASGKYFMVVDGDDWVNSDKFAYVIKMINNAKKEVDLYVNPYYEAFPSTGEYKYINMNSDSLKRYKIYKFKDLQNYETYFALASSIFKTSILQNMQLKILEHSSYVDCEYILFPIKHVETVLFTDKEVYVYRKGDENQTVSIKSFSEKYHEHANVCKRLIEYLSNNSLDKCHYLYYERVLLAILYTHYTIPLNDEFDKKNAQLITSQFDSFLNKTNITIYRKISSYSIIREIQDARFDYLKLAKLKATKKKKIRKVLKKIVINKFTYKLIKSRFFSHGFGLKVKEMLKRIFKKI